jgi:hypothetical protein
MVWDIDTVNRLTEVVEEVDSTYLPRLRWLLLGNLAGSQLFPEGFCVKPTKTELQRFLAQLEVRGHTYQSELLQRLSNVRPDRAMQHLDHLETLAPKSWKHPVTVLNRPWELDRMVQLCEERLAATTDARYQALLETIIPKLRRAQTVEGKAAERRKSESLTNAARPRTRRKPGVRR